VPALIEVVKPGKFTVTKAAPKSPSQLFALPGLNTGDSTGVILMFMVSGENGSKLSMSNKKTATTTPPQDLFDLLLDDTFTTPRARFQVLEANKFAATKNEITITLDHPKTGQDITVSEVVIFYHD
jgi:hypothetical protein